MDVRDLPPHDWDDCGYEIAKLHSADQTKYDAILEAWWDTDEDDQMAIHEFLCENRRNPEALDAARQFEKAADEAERVKRERAEKRRAEEAAKALAAGTAKVRGAVAEAGAQAARLQPYFAEATGKWEALKGEARISLEEVAEPIKFYTRTDVQLDYRPTRTDRGQPF